MKNSRDRVALMDEQIAEQIAAWRERIQVKERTLSRTGDEYLKSVLRADINWLRQKVRDAEQSTRWYDLTK